MYTIQKFIRFFSDLGLTFATIPSMPWSDREWTPQRPGGQASLARPGGTTDANPTDDWGGEYKLYVVNTMMYINVYIYVNIYIYVHLYTLQYILYKLYMYMNLFLGHFAKESSQLFMLWSSWYVGMLIHVDLPNYIMRGHMNRRIGPRCIWSGDGFDSLIKEVKWQKDFSRVSLSHVDGDQPDCKSRRECRECKPNTFV